jgi:malyl-CoA/(S)-citramalyl-CoA lyase
MTTTSETSRIRPYRSVLMVPGSRPEFFAKAVAGPADAICLDLEDAVAPAEKGNARARVIEALKAMDWGNKHLICRINALDTIWWYRDVIDLVEQGGERLDAIMVPKVQCGADLHAVDVLAIQAAQVGGRKRPMLLDIQAETARGLVRLDEIAGTTPRLTAIHFGHGDFAASMGMRTTEIGADSADYAVADPASGVVAPGDAWHYPMMHLVMVARSHGVLPVAGPFGRFSDLATLEQIARRNAFMGYAAKWAIHPGQVDTINAAFSPRPEEIARARALLEAVDAAEAQGLGAVSRDGVLIDGVSIRQARQILALVRDD